MYQATDRFLKSLKAQIRSEFNHLSVMSFDELNVVRVKKETTEMFKRLLAFNMSEYNKIVDEAREYALSLLDEKERKKAAKETADENWRESFIDYVLTTYNWVTGYLYKKEAERKRLRLSEEMLTAREFHDRKRYASSLSKTANLWFTQSGQYAIDLEDKTCLDVWKRAGVKKVQWLAEDDHKTCSVCRKLDGQVFDIDKVPHKAHYNCRCVVIPYKDILDFADNGE